jgi:hypothetical protein
LRLGAVTKLPNNRYSEMTFSLGSISSLSLIHSSKDPCGALQDTCCLDIWADNRLSESNPQKCGSVRVGDYTTETREWLPIHIRENPRFENRNLRRPGGSASIFGRLLDVIDDKNHNWRFGRFEFQSKLFPERGENRETRWIGYGARFRGVLRHVSSPLQM